MISFVCVCKKSPINSEAIELTTSVKMYKNLCIAVQENSAEEQELSYSTNLYRVNARKAQNASSLIRTRFGV